MPQYVGSGALNVKAENGSHSFLSAHGPAGREYLRPDLRPEGCDMRLDLRL